MQVLSSSLLTNGGNPYSLKGGPFEEEDIVSIVDDSDEKLIDACCEKTVSDEDGEDEQEDIFLKDIEMLKLWARYYLHPEDRLQVDPNTAARCYFTRPSAFVDMDDDTNIEERESILADCALLKSWAKAYLHPEAPVTIDPSTVARCYFNRPSAASMDDADMEERESILSDCALLKSWAKAYLHPEAPVTVDPTTFGRNYFYRPSATMETDVTDMQELERIMADCAMLKTLRHIIITPRPLSRSILQSLVVTTSIVHLLQVWTIQIWRSVRVSFRTVLC